MKVRFNILKIFIFIIIVLSAGAVFLIIANNKTEHHDRILHLRKFYKKIGYVNQVLYNNHKKKFKTICNNKKDNSVLIAFSKYIRGKEIYKGDYSYRYGNGMKVKREDIFYFDKFILTPSNGLVGIKLNCQAKTNRGLVFYDYNGEKKPNLIGKDIFFFTFDNDKIYPWGFDKAQSSAQDECNRFSTGTFCGMFYITGAKTQE